MSFSKKELNLKIQLFIWEQKSLLVNLLSDLQIKIAENKTTNQPYEKRNTGNESKVEDKDKKTDVQSKLEFTNEYEV